MIRRRVADPATGDPTSTAQWSIEAAFAAAERDGLRFLLRVRFAVLGAVAIWLIANYAPRRLAMGLLAIAGFALSGLAQYGLGRRWGRPVFWAGVFAVFEVALLVVVVLAPFTFPGDWPPQMQLRLVTVFYLFVYVAGTVLSYSPSLVVWTGALTAVGWGVGHRIMLTLPGTVTAHGPLIDTPGLSPSGSLALYLDPRFVSDAAWRTQTVLLLILTLVLATAVARSRSLLRRQVADHLARANLARYFSPNVVDMLATAGPTGTAARHQRVAVLFADVRGFTRISESIGAERTMAFLQGFHERVTPVIFAHGGTLEKYIGDAVMATFGTPSPGPHDASRALRCALTLVVETHRWSAERVSRGELPVEIGIGAHYGEAVVGSIGDGQRLDYLVIGDTVNVTSRLERLTREIDAQIVVTDELVVRVRDEGTADGLLDRFAPRGEVSVAGRDRPVSVWTVEREKPV
ncbi:MAG TPA: adenylate/guanylate cyclase domain-containing protein [Candidatus Methylomirabilis sp.]|nr:adenylate/guanylate cyclase domain-containing protein [Candidatus Methylomirabilis sp.]